MYNPRPNDGSTFKFPLQCFWLKLNGSWPVETQNETFKRLYNAWSWYVVFSVGITIYFQTVFLIFTFGDILKTTENCCTTFMGALNFIRIVHLKMNQKPFKLILRNFVKSIWIKKGSNPRIENECQSNMKIFSLVSIMMMCLILMYCFLPLIELFSNPNADEKPFPYKMIFFYDANHGWKYVFTYIFTSFAGMCVVTTLFAEDSLIGFFVTYTCGQLRILHEDCYKIIPQAHRKVVAENGKISVPEVHFQREYVRQLHVIAKRHSEIINFAQSLEKFNSPHLLANFSISSILICMVGFQLVTGKMFIGDYLKFLVYILSALSQLFILCWNGDNLIQCSLKTAWHLYACNWEGGELSQQDKKMKQDAIKYCPAGRDFNLKLKLMIMRSQKPLQITAMKFSVLSLESFTKILSSSMSYFTLLQTMLEK
ncbi:odorant receptor 13a [Episyrphus balteatus]|uniref:odorant receptor 13a n=1 Tax=Episyrphus balteatus TaxID=286459 RepID=UPI002485C6EA|nr:odorant receptor 13a [Episyrphus balteatus]